MRHDLENARIKVIKPRIKKYCTCPYCGKKQIFKKKKEHWKLVKEIDINSTLLLKVQIIYAKCSNPECKVKSFPLPIKGIKKYQRATERLKREAIAGIVEDNSTLLRISRRLNRSFNTTGSKSSIDRWKHREASRYDFKEIIHKLGFSGVLTLDEYMPKRGENYALIAGDAVRKRILYIESVSLFYGKGEIEKFLLRLKEFGIEAWAAVIDFWVGFPRQLRKLWPDILIQYDYFHIMQWIYKFLKNCILKYRRELKRKGFKEMEEELWEHRWRLLKGRRNWSKKDEEIIKELKEIYKHTFLDDILNFKEKVEDIFNKSRSKEEAYFRRESLVRENFWRKSEELSRIMKFLMSDKFEYMITYLEYPKIPRCGCEGLIRTWRQIEKVRYGFKTEKGLQII